MKVYKLIDGNQAVGYRFCCGDIKWDCLGSAPFIDNIPCKELRGIVLYGMFYTRAELGRFENYHMSADDVCYYNLKELYERFHNFDIGKTLKTRLGDARITGYSAGSGYINIVWAEHNENGLVHQRDIGILDVA